MIQKISDEFKNCIWMKREGISAKASTSKKKDFPVKT
jgi:hypothetical protein